MCLVKVKRNLIKPQVLLRMFSFYLSFKEKEKKHFYILGHQDQPGEVIIFIIVAKLQMMLWACFEQKWLSLVQSFC